MRSSVIITPLRGLGHKIDVVGRFGGGYSRVHAGPPEELALIAAGAMARYAQTNPEGGDLVAPAEVMEAVPEHLRSVNPASQSAVILGGRGGAIGGRSKSKRKVAAARRNAKLGGRPAKT